MNNLSVLVEKDVLNKQFKVYGTAEEPLFLASDVAEWIEHSNPTVMLQTIDDSEKGLNNVYTLGGIQEKWFLTEDGLYEVLMRSRKPIAKQFKREVKTILKSIRTTGTFTMKPPQPMTQLEVMRNMLDAQIQSDKRIERLEAKIETALERPVTVDWCKWANAKINQIVESNGLNHHVYRGELYRELEQTARCNITIRQTRLRGRLRAAGHKYSDCQSVSKLQVIDSDPKLRAIFESIVKRESARCTL